MGNNIQKLTYTEVVDYLEFRIQDAKDSDYNHCGEEILTTWRKFLYKHCEVVGDVFIHKADEDSIELNGDVINL